MLRCVRLFICLSVLCPSSTTVHFTRMDIVIGYNRTLTGNSIISHHMEEIEAGSELTGQRTATVSGRDGNEAVAGAVLQAFAR